MPSSSSNNPSQPPHPNPNPQPQRRYSSTTQTPSGNANSQPTSSAHTLSPTTLYRHPTFIESNPPYPPPLRPSQARPPPDCPLPQSNMSLSTAVSGGYVNGEMNLLAEVALAHGGNTQGSLVLPPIMTEERGRAERGRGMERRVVAQAAQRAPRNTMDGLPYVRPRFLSPFTVARSSSREAPQAQDPSSSHPTHPATASQSVLPLQSPTERPQQGTQSSPTLPSSRLPMSEPSAFSTSRSQRQQPPSLHTRLAARSQRYHNSQTQESQSSNSTQPSQYSQTSQHTQSTQPTEYSQQSQRSQPSQGSSSSLQDRAGPASQGPRWIRHTEQVPAQLPPSQHQIQYPYNQQPPQLLAQSHLSRPPQPAREPHSSDAESRFRFAPPYHPPEQRPYHPENQRPYYEIRQDQHPALIQPNTSQPTGSPQQQPRPQPSRIRPLISGWNHPLRGLTLDGSQRTPAEWEEDARRVLRTPVSVMGVTFMDDDDDEGYSDKEERVPRQGEEAGYLTPITGSNLEPQPHDPVRSTNDTLNTGPLPPEMTTPNVRRSLRIAPPSAARTHSSSLSSTQSAPAKYFSPSPTTSSRPKPKRAASTPGTESRAKRGRIEDIEEDDADEDMGDTPLNELGESSGEGGKRKWPRRVGDRRKFQNATAQKKHRDKKRELAIRDKIDLELERKSGVEKSRRIQALEKEVAMLKGEEKTGD